jgi:hypothetical protein
MDRECCGTRCETPFCPHCGRAVGPARPLRDLLAYLRRRATDCHRRAARQREWIADRERTTGPERTEADRRRSEAVLARREATATRWQAWHDALAELVAREEDRSC